MLLAALDHAHRGDGGPHFIFPLILLIALGLLAGFVIRRRRSGSPHHGSPLRTLQERFARGEIDRAEFDHRRAVLEQDDDVPPAPTRPAPPAPAAEGDDESLPDIADDE